jgi:hypothetical protein
MRKFLQSLSPKLLAKIAADHGCTSKERIVQIEFLMEQAKGYGLNVADFRSRYQIREC